MPLWTRLFALGGFGALGAVCRYLVGVGAVRLLPAHPWSGTLVANVLGCLLFGGIFHLSVEGGFISEPWRLLLLTGFLGAFTTFSAYTVDAILLLDARGWPAFAGYLLAQNVLGIGAALAGMAGAGFLSR